MSLIRRFKRRGRIHLAEVEDKWVNGACVQRHIRYVGREGDDETQLAGSLSET
jgi:hypothetical protein